MKKNIVLLVNDVMRPNEEALELLSKELDFELIGYVLVDQRHKDSPRRRRSSVFTEIYADIDEPLSIEAALEPIRDKILVVTCRNEPNLTLLRKLVPHLPDVEMPTEESLISATSKYEMRKRFAAKDPTISPVFMNVTTYSDEIVSQLDKAVGYPAIVKPAGLMSSLLVQEVENKEQLQVALQEIFEYIQGVHDKVGRHEIPELVVEQRMHGLLYSIDSYIAPDGRIWHCPAVTYVDGKQAGYDDFFCYNRSAPAANPITKEEELEAQKVVEKGIQALCLRASSAHTELMKTNDGWKLIEIGPRIGGYRHQMYKQAYGIKHTLNDMKVRIGIEPEVNTTVIGYSAVYSFYPKAEGELVKIHGLDEIRQLTSCREVTVYAKEGSYVRFSRNGGERVVTVILGADSKETMQKDIQDMEKLLIIETR